LNSTHPLSPNVTFKDCPNPNACGLVDFFDLVEQLEVLFLLLHGPIGELNLFDFPQALQLLRRERDHPMLRELNEQASVLFDERLDEREHGTNVEATVRLLRRRRIRVSRAELALQPAHIVDEQARHALQFLQPAVEVHASQDTNDHAQAQYDPVYFTPSESVVGRDASP
jgi:hypothetical protein